MDWQCLYIDYDELQQLFTFSTAMIQSSTFSFQAILLKFYRILTENHPKKQQNRQQIKTMLQTVTSKIQSESNQQQLKYLKKTSLATECSLSEQSQPVIPLQKRLNSQNQLYFTFCPEIHQISHQSNEEIINFKYRSHSVHKILLYAIFFNHFHLQTLVQRVPLKIAHIFNLTQEIIESTNVIMQSIWKQNKRDWKGNEGQSLLHLIYYLHNFQYYNERKLNLDLKYLVNGLDDDVVREILNRLAHYNYNPRNKLQNKQKIGQKYSKCINDTSLRQIQADQASFMEQLALTLNIRIKFQNKNERQSLGNRNAKICFVVKQQSTKNGFYLKGIIYYKESERVKSQISRQEDRSSESGQYVEI